MNAIDNRSNDMKKKLTEERLNRIDILFAAFGPLFRHFSALYSIFRRDNVFQNHCC